MLSVELSNQFTGGRESDMSIVKAVGDLCDCMEKTHGKTWAWMTFGLFFLLLILCFGEAVVIGILAAG
jgi:hypothetical protein